MILLNILCRYWYIYFNVTDKNIFFFFFGIRIDQTCLLSIPLFVLTLSLFFSHSGHANMVTTRLPFTELRESLVQGISPGGEGLGGRHSTNFYTRTGSAPSSNPLQLPFYVPFFTRKVPLSCTFYWQILWYPFHIPCLELCIPFNCCKCTVF